MANTADDNCPLVKLTVAILDDPHGISTEAWDALTETFKQQYGTRPPPPLIQKIMGAIDGCDGRVYLPEGWNDQEERLTTLKDRLDEVKTKAKARSKTYGG